MAQKPKPVDEAETRTAETTEPKAEKAPARKAGPKKPASKPRRGAEPGPAMSKTATPKTATPKTATSKTAETPEATPEPAAQAPDPARKPTEAPVWSSWTPSEGADIEIRWRVLGEDPGPKKSSFAVEVLYLQYLAPGLPPSARRTPVQTAEGLTSKQLIVKSTLTPEDPELPFSLFTASDPKPLFKGTLEAVYSKKPEEPACDGEEKGEREETYYSSLWVRNLVYRTGSVAEHQLYSPASPSETSDA